MLKKDIHTIDQLEEIVDLWKNKTLAQKYTLPSDEDIENTNARAKDVSFKDYSRLIKIFKVTRLECERLRKASDKLTCEKNVWNEDKEMLDKLVKQKVKQSIENHLYIEKQSEQIKFLENTNTYLSRKVCDLEAYTEERCHLETMTHRQEIERLTIELDIKNKELTRCQKLVRRSNLENGLVERFFLDSLTKIKQEINKNKAFKQEEIDRKYRKQLLEAAGASKVPSLKSRTQKLMISNTNFNSTSKNCYQMFKDEKNDLEIKGEIKTNDFTELTWEEKERVLTDLYSKILNERKRALTKKDKIPQFDLGSAAILNGTTKLIPMIENKPEVEQKTPLEIAYPHDEKTEKPDKNSKSTNPTFLTQINL